MNRLIRYIAALSLALTATPAHAISLSDLFAGGTIQVGDKLFADWEELNNEFCPSTGCISGGVDTASIDVTAVGDGTAGNAYGLQFTGSNASWSATGDEFIDLWFRFSVAAVDPTQRITGAVMTGTTSTLGDAHLVVVEKDIYNFITTDHLAFMEIFSDPLDTPSLDLNDMADLGSQSKIWVEDNVFVDGFGGSAQLIEFTQRFEQTALAAPAIDIEKATNGVDADDPNAGDTPVIAPGDPVTWTYVVTNTGNVDLTNVTVVDDQGVAVSCPQTTLAVGEAMTCTANGTAEDLNTTGFTTVPGTCGIEPNVLLYENMGKATGDYLAQRVEDTDPSHYCNPRVNLAPVAVNNNYTEFEDNQIAGNVITDDTGLGMDSDADGDGMSIDSNTDVSHGTLVLNADGSFTYDPTLNYCGPDGFTYVITDDPPAIAPAMTSNTATVSITVTCRNDPPVVTIVSPGAQTSDYSDFIGTVTVTATDIDDTILTLAQSGAPANLPDPALNVTTNCIAVPNDSIMDGSSCTWTMDGQVLVPGDNDHNIDFTANDGEASSVCGGAAGVCRHVLSVEAEDATVMLDEDNEVSLQVPEDDGPSGEFFFHFSAWETSDPEDHPHDGSARSGNLNRMVPYMTLIPVGPGGPVDGDCKFIDPLPADTETPPQTDYSQVAYFECKFDEVPVNTYEVVAAVDGSAEDVEHTRYYLGSDEGVFTVFDPSLGFVTGGGWFYWPGTATDDSDCGPDGYPGDKTNFGFGMKYNKKGKNLQGSLLMMRHTVNDDCLGDGNFKVKSNALNGMSVGKAEDADGLYGWASVTGKATFREPGQDNTGGNPFMLYIEDHGEQGCNQNPVDEFWIEVTTKDGILLLQLNGSEPADNDPANDGHDEPIECGNIVVPHKAGGKGRGKR